MCYQRSVVSVLTYKTKNPNASPIGEMFGLLVFGGQGWIRIIEVVDGRFTVGFRKISKLRKVGI